MRKAATIFFLVIFCASFTETHQLFRLPLLVKHYIKHKTENQHISFSKFIQLHYMSEEKNDTDQPEDQQLPFKTYNNIGFTVYQPQPVTASPVAHPTIISSNYPLVQNKSLSAGFNGSVFHPPRFS